MADCLESKEDILLLFDKEDVLVEEISRSAVGDGGTILYIRPAKKYNSNTHLNYLIKIVFDRWKKFEQIRIVGDVQFSLETERVECYGENPVPTLTKTIISSILSNYDTACENFRKYYKNMKIAEIREICDKFTV